MGGWKRQQGEIRRQEVKEIRSHYRKPPLGDSFCSVPAWEKKFCYSIGLVSWKKLLETKKYSYLYENVVHWNDSAVEEAFHNAKSRFWAQINGLPCKVSLPDPDIYIDEVDWDASIDQELYNDLEREPEAPVFEAKEEVISCLGNTLGLNQSFTCTGWGDTEEDLPKLTSFPWNQTVDNGVNSWGYSYNYGQINGDVKNDEWNDPSGWNDWENRCTGWNDYKEAENKVVYEGGWNDYKEAENKVVYEGGWNDWENSCTGWNDNKEPENKVVYEGGWNDWANRYTGWNEYKVSENKVVYEGGWADCNEAINKNGYGEWRNYNEPENGNSRRKEGGHQYKTSTSTRVRSDGYNNKREWVIKGGRKECILQV